MEEFQQHQKKIGGVGTNQRGAPLFPKRFKSTLNLRTIDTQPKQRSLERQFRYNLSPDHQHVKATFKDTTKAVEKLRKEAQEKREELRAKKKLADEVRLTQWGCETKS